MSIINSQMFVAFMVRVIGDIIVKTDVIFSFWKVVEVTPEDLSEEDFAIFSKYSVKNNNNKNLHNSEERAPSFCVEQTD